jgi:hypothetical protein
MQGSVYNSFVELISLIFSRNLPVLDEEIYKINDRRIRKLFN